MDHNEATEQMVAERYLLGELTPELRDAFEEHAFDCPECSVDLRAGATFIGAAKVELPKIAEVSAAMPKPEIIRPAKKKMDWQAWLRPAFAVPVFAALLALRCLPEPRYDSLAPQGGKRAERAPIDSLPCRHARCNSHFSRSRSHSGSDTFD